MSALACPCDAQRSYVACCQPLHDGIVARDAETLMRSRYSAYALGRHDYLLASWHVDTRPAAQALLEETPGTWLGLQVRAHRRIDDAHAEVEFVARWRPGGARARRLHEISRFVRVDGRWFYLDGRFPLTEK